MMAKLDYEKASRSLKARHDVQDALSEGAQEDVFVLREERIVDKLSRERRDFIQGQLASGKKRKFKNQSARSEATKPKRKITRMISPGEFPISKKDSKKSVGLKALGKTQIPLAELLVEAYAPCNESIRKGKEKKAKWEYHQALESRNGFAEGEFDSLLKFELNLGDAYMATSKFNYAHYHLNQALKFAKGENTTGDVGKRLEALRLAEEKAKEKAEVDRLRQKRQEERYRAKLRKLSENFGSRSGRCRVIAEPVGPIRLLEDGDEGYYPSDYGYEDCPG